MSGQQTPPSDQASRAPIPGTDQRPGEATTTPRPGRGIVLTPVPAGTWLLALGFGLAGLGPLAGFLAGSMAGIGQGIDAGSARFSAIYLFLFLGLAVGALGLVLAGLGGLRVYRGRRARRKAAAG